MRAAAEFALHDVSITLINSTVSGNTTDEEGGGIYALEGSSITVISSTISGNSASNYGGGIVVDRGSITLINSTVSGNSAGFGGGGIRGDDFATITLTNATIAGNTARFGGGISLEAGSLTLTNTSVSGNSAVLFGGGGIASAGSVALANSIVAGNNAYDGLADLYSFSSPTYTGGNIVGDTFTVDGGSPQGGVALTDIFAAIDPLTGGGQLADNGGPVQTIALNPDAANPAIDTGGTAVLDEAQAGIDLNGDGDTDDVITTDARGFARNVGAGVDLGAFELQNFVVTTLDDELDAADTDPLTADFSDLSLREALALANGDAGANTITFAAGLAGNTLFLTMGQELAITTDGITVDGDIDHDGDADIEISANFAEGADDAATRVFLIDGAGAGTIGATLNGLVIRDGVTDDLGGGIHVGQADALTLSNVIVSGNSSGGGGGIFGDEFATITLTNATVSGNSSGSSGGGGILVFTDATLTLTNATVSGNSAGIGGGIAGFGSSIVLTNATVFGNTAVDLGIFFANGGGISALGGSLTLINTTVSGNAAEDDGGGISGNVTLANSIVTGNDAGAAGDDLQGASILAGGNIVGDTFSIDGVDQPGTIALTDIFAAVANNPHSGVLSGVLADNGGAVETIALNPDATNPAIDSGDPALLDEAQAGRDLNGDGDQLDTITTDARGLARDVDFDGPPPGPDLGAFERRTRSTSSSPRSTTSSTPPTLISRPSTSPTCRCARRWRSPTAIWIRSRTRSSVSTPRWQATCCS